MAFQHHQKLLPGCPSNFADWSTLRRFSQPPCLRLAGPLSLAYRFPLRYVRVALLFCVSPAWIFGENPSLAGGSTFTAPPRLTSTAPQSSAKYLEVQRQLARGWNTWDVHSVATQVSLPAGLAVHVAMGHNTTEGGDDLLGDTLIGRLDPHAEQVFPGAHSWNGSYTDLRISWKGHRWRLRSAHDGEDLVLLAEPLPSEKASSLPPTIVFSVNYLWNRPGTVDHLGHEIVANDGSRRTSIYCTCADPRSRSGFAPALNLAVSGPYFWADFTEPVGLSTGKARNLAAIEAVIERESKAYQRSVDGAGPGAVTADAIQTTLGWDTIFEPESQRVISPVSRVWSVNWGGYVIFDWDTFFAATMASIGSRNLAYADAVETLRTLTPEGFVPNYARAGNWKSADRSEPPVGAITVLGIYQKFGEPWFLQEAFEPLLRWNRWWAQHRDIQGYLTWGSDGSNPTRNLDDRSPGTRVGAILESGLDNSPMYDDTVYNSDNHLLEYADVGLMSMYIADCDALAEIAKVLGKTSDEKEVLDRASRYRAKLATLWSDQAGIFLNKDLDTGEFNHRLSPTNFYPMMARAATTAQANEMIQKHLLNPDEFWGEWVVPSIARNDPAFHDQNYWRGRVWGPMNYLVYLGLCQYASPDVRKQFAQKSYDLFSKEWKANGHVHENYNSITGSGDDVASSDRFYHWGALLGFIQYQEQSKTTKETAPSH